MGRWRTQTETWLTAEQRGEDDVADSALGGLFGALPAVEPSPAFVSRATGAVWSARARRRRMAGLAAAAAALLVVGTSAAVLYTVLDGRVAWLLATGAGLASGAARSLLTAAAAGAGWWSVAAEAGLTIARAIASPYSMAALTAMELVAVAALVMLHRLLRSEVEFRTPRAYCF